MGNKTKIVSMIVIFLFILCPALLLAERTIRGKIIDPCDSTGWPGVLVKAYDRDSITDDEFMGQNITDANGNYAITYRRGTWDPDVPFTTKKRPDIYIKIYRADKPGQWKKIDESKVYGDHEVKNDLIINHKIDIIIPAGSGLGKGGVYGVITNANTGKPVHPAKVCLTWPSGYYRLPPKCIDNNEDGGFFINTSFGMCGILRITADGYRPREIQGIIVANQAPVYAPAKLIPIPGYVATGRQLGEKMIMQRRLNVNLPKPDLFVKQFSILVSAVRNVQVLYQIENASLAPISTRFGVSFYISKSKTRDSSSKYIGSKSIGSLNANSTWPASAPYRWVYRLPGGLSAGSYYIGIIIDSDNRVKEADENNNSMWVPAVIK